jgi:hypothetical protein
MNRACVAYHEASHAVVARALGVDVFSVSIEPCATSSGRVQLGSDVGHHQHVLISMAGPIGEHIFEPSIFGGNGDAADVRRHMTALGAHAHRWPVYQAAARKLVKANWPAIKTVAAELLRQGRMNGFRVDVIIAEARR